jgi:nucleoside triphosphate diphosphatase
MNADDRESRAFAALVGVCRKLRGPEGCPWDREQTLESMTPYLTEEAVESGEAIASGNHADIAEELGDLAFLAVFCMELLSERGGPGLAESFENAAQKLIRRHPHVYGDAKVADGDAAYRQWQEIKRSERPDAPVSLLGKEPKGLPALVTAYRVQEKAAAVGFDWAEAASAVAKLHEEISEVEQAAAGDTTPDVAREIGDMLFAAVNVARKLGVDPERELRAATHRFRGRFHHIEQRLTERGRKPSESTLEEMDALWEEAKALGIGTGSAPGAQEKS